MTMTTSFALILAVGMLITGSINTISTKLADNQNVTGLDPTTPHTFNHPFFQAVLMFLGESLCLLTFWSKRYLCSKKKDDTAASSSNEALLSNNRNRTRSSSSLNSASPSSSTKSNWSPLIFLLPACCDMTGTSLMYVGLNLTHASVFQMLRGSVILFTGIFSVFFLGRKLYAFHWIGMSLVLTGTMIVGVASVLYPDGNTSSASNPLLGDIIIILAQIVAAVQMVVEEKLIGGHGIPALQAVGWEGVWGFTVLSVVLIGMYYAPGVTGFTPTLSHFENTPDALVQISRSGPLAAACMGNILSIAFFNFFGLSVTKYMSATHRMILDSLRTIVIWAVSLFLGWQSFNYLQLVGFFFLLTGTMVYNEVGGHLPGLYYPSEEDLKREKRERRLSIANRRKAFDTENAGLVMDTTLLVDEEGNPTSPRADDWFSPKATHYTQGSRKH